MQTLRRTLTSTTTIVTFAVITLWLSLLSNAQAHTDNTTRQAIAIDYLIGESDISGLRLAYRPYHTRIEDAFLLGDVDIYWEVGMNFWEYGPQNNHETNYAISLSPVFTWKLAELADKYLLRAEFGIGVSLVEDTRFAGRDIGSHYQFEDRIGLTLEFGDDLEHAASLRYMHYSNGGLDDNNSGMDFLVLSCARYF